MRIRDLAVLSVAAAALIPTAASARRVVVDTDGLTTLQGYCDFNGADCVAQNLNFSVDFGNGPTSSFFIYGNGLVSFGAAPIDYSQSQNYSTGSDLSIFGGNVISAGLFNSIEQDYYGTNEQVFSTRAYVSANTANGFSVVFEYCANVQGFISCDRQASIDVSRTADGLHVALSNDGRPNGYYGPGYTGYGFYNGGSPGTVAAGYSINGTTQMYDTPNCNAFTGTCLTGGAFDLSARIADLSSGVPEPATWAMMMLGFGAMGAALRRRKTDVQIRCA